MPQLELYLCFGDGISEHFPPALILNSSQLTCAVITPNPAVSQHSSKKCVYGLLTSTEWFQSLGVSFHFQVSAQVNTAIRASTICRDSPLLPWQVQENNTTHEVQSLRGSKQHLVGYCVLVGEPLFARKIFVHCWNDLQDVVVWGQSCKTHQVISKHDSTKICLQCPKMEAARRGFSISVCMWQPSTQRLISLPRSLACQRAALHKHGGGYNEYMCNVQTYG